jgi:predicted RNA-binding protein Jag
MPELNAEAIRPTLEEFLRGVLRAARIQLLFRIEPGPGGEQPDVLVLFEGEDEDLLLQHGGELLAALEHLVAKMLRLPSEEQGRLSFDCRDFKMLAPGGRTALDG